MALPQTKPEPDSVSLLATEFVKRLAQLGISQREFARRVDISRQTIHHIVNEGRTDLRPSTLAAVDRGLRWRPGTALALSQGDRDALSADSDTLTMEDRTDATRWRLVARIHSMTVDELDRLVGMIDGPFGNDDETGLDNLRDRIASLEDRLR